MLIPIFLTAGQINFTYTNYIVDIVKVDGVWWLATNGGLVRYVKETGKIKVYNRGNSNIPSNHVEIVVADENGNIWIATPYGIGKFDGNQFEIFDKANGSLLCNKIKLMDYEQDKGLWVVTDSALSLYNGSSWERFEKDEEGTVLNALTIDAFRPASPYGLLLSVNGKLKFLNHDGTFNDMGFQTDEMVSGVGFNGDNNPVITTQGDGVYIGQNNGTFLQYNTGNSPMRSDVIYALEISPQGDFYFNCGQSGFAVLHWDDTWDVFPYQDGTLLSSITAIYAGDNEVGLGTDYPYRGFVHGDYSTGYYQFPDTCTVLQTSPVNSNIVYDVAVKDGKKYIGCFSGSDQSGEIDILDDQNKLYKKYNGTSSNVFYSVLPRLLEVDDFNNIWFADDINYDPFPVNEGLFKVNNDNVTEIPPSELGLSVVYASGMQWIRDFDVNGNIIGSLWLSAEDNNVDRITYYDSVWNALPWEPDNADYPDMFFQMVHDSLGTWFASGGIYQWKDGQFISYWYDAPVKTARSVIRDKYGNLWFGAVTDEPMGWQGGIAIYHPDSGSWEYLNSDNSALPDDNVTCLAKDVTGNIWAGTMLGGLVKIDTTGHMTVFNRDNSFLDNNYIRQITVDSLTNDLWIINNESGVFVYNEDHDIINKVPENHKGPVIAVKSYPNPFHSFTTFEFTLDKKEAVNLTVYDLAGKVIKELFSGMTDKGHHSIRFESGSLPAGVYFCTLQTPEGSVTAKIVKAYR
jgi:hypothetical protein